MEGRLMTTILYIFLLVTSVFLSGCCRARQVPEDQATDNEEYRILQIKNLTMTETTLTLDYQVSNPFAYDIWICEDIDIDGRYNVETRVNAETVRIKLRFNLECNILLEEGVMAKYRRLSRGESHSGKILLNLPIENASPVYDFGEFGKKHKQIVLHHAVFEVGYFEGDLLNILSERIEKGKLDPTNVNFYSEALMLEEIQQAHSHNTVYLPHLWSGLRMEKSAEVVVTDVDIPCSVVVEDK